MNGLRPSLLLHVLLTLILLEITQQTVQQCCAFVILPVDDAVRTGSIPFDYDCYHYKTVDRRCHNSAKKNSRYLALSDKYYENDLVAIPYGPNNLPRLCVVSQDTTVIPLCLHENDVETDLFIDPREYYSKMTFWSSITDDQLYQNGKTYGEGFYGQRPVPSLRGGPGYGASADEIWSITEGILEILKNDGIHIHVLDVGISHGEKARGGVI